jgi:PAS domain S-box-containing protein
MASRKSSPKKQSVSLPGEEHFHLLFHNHPIPMWVYDLKTLAFLEVNAAAVEKFGYSRAEFLKMKIQKLLLPEEKPRLKADFDRERPALQHSGEWRHRLKDGRVIDVEVTSHTLEFNGRKAALVMAQDVTERKQAEKDRQTAEAGYRAIIENAPVGIFQSTPEGRFLSVNPFMARIYGYASPEEMLASITDITNQIYVDPANRREFQRQLAEHGEVREFAKEIYCKDGRRSWTLTSARAVREAGGKILYYEGFLTDITARKHAEDQLRLSETTYQGILNSITEAVYIQNENGVFLDVNQTSEKMYGYSRSDFIGRTPEFLSAPGRNDLAAIVEFVRKAYAGEPQQFEFWGLRKDGSILPKDVSLTPGVYFGKKAVIAVARDITERKRAEQALMESEQRYRAVVENSLAGVYITTLKGEILYMNDAVRQIFEYDTTEELKSAGVLAVYKNPKDRDLFLRSLRETGKIDSIEIEATTKTGRTKIVDLYATLTGEIITGLLIDITERKQMAVALAESEKSYRMLFENMPLGLYRTAPDGRILDANPELVKLFGFQERATLLAVNANDLYVDPGVRGRFKVNAEQTEKITNYEAEYKRPDGTTFWAEDNIRVIRDEQGRILFYEGSLIDITERKQAEEALRQREEQYRVLFETAPIGIGVASRSGQLLVFNEASLKPGGYTREDIQKMGGVQGLYYDSRQRMQILSIFEKQGALSQYPVQFKRKDGTPYDALLTLTPTWFEGQLAVQAIVEDITERKRSEEAVRHQLDRLAALREIDAAITGSMDMRLALNILLAHASAELGGDAVNVLLLNTHTQTLEYYAGRGFRTSGIEHSRLRLGEGFAGRAALERATVAIPDLSVASEKFIRAHLLVGEDFVTYHCVPLIAKGQVKGVLEVFHRAAFTPTDEWLNFLETLAGQAAIAIDNAQLFEDLQRSNMELILAYDATIEGWSRAMDLRDKETEGHTQRVTDLTIRLARELGMNEDQLLHVRRGALLHDMGKLGIPDSILHKPGELTAGEKAIMQYHPQYANDMLSQIAYLRPAIDIPYCHHEHWDGTGYPRGLKGGQIPLAARIFAVIDVWDALSFDRPYRKGWPEEKVVAHIKEQAGAYFDPQVVEAFLKIRDETL